MYVVMKSKKRVLFHLPLSAIAKRIFTIVTLCAFEFEFENNNKLAVTCCGKVNIFIENSKRNILGYIMDEEYGRWCILLKDNTVIRSRPVTYNNETGQYTFPLSQNSRKGHYIITQYWPIRILVYTRGEIRFTCNRVGFKNGKLFPQLCS